MITRETRLQLSRYSDKPLFNIQAVAAATEVPAITLRSWERRYNVPVPSRDKKGYRLYSERDIATVRWLKERVQEGVGISRAVHMLQVTEEEVVNVQPDASFDYGVLQQQLIDAIQRLDADGVNWIVSAALMAGSVEDMCLHLLQPTLYEIGDLWAAGELSVTSEHVGSNILRSLVAQLLRLSPPRHRDSQIVVACAPTEQHDIGALMIALFLRRRGFDVVYAGANVEADSFIADMDRLKPAAICLSAASAESARALTELYDKLRARFDGVLAFGGKYFNEEESAKDSVRGVWLGADAAGAVQRLDTALVNLNLSARKG